MYPKPAPTPFSANEVRERSDAVAASVRYLLDRWPVNSTAYFEGRAYDVIGASGSFCVGVAGDEVRLFLHLRSAAHPQLVYAVPHEACSPRAPEYGPPPPAGLYHLWAFAVGPLARGNERRGGAHERPKSTDANQAQSGG